MIDLARAERVAALLGRLRHPVDLSFHRGGRRVAVAVSPALREAGAPSESRIWDVPLDGGEPMLLTGGPGTEALPRWSPTDDRLAFAASRPVPGRMDPFVLEPGSEPRRIGGIEGSVQDLRWLPDGRGLLILAVEEGGFGAATEGAVRLRWTEPPADPEVFRPEQGRRRLFLADPGTGEVREVGPEGWSVWEFDLVDARHAVAVASEDPSESGWYHACLVLCDLGERTAQVLHRPEQQIQGPAVDPTGRRAAFLEGWSSDRGLLAGDLRVLDLGRGELLPTAGARSDLSWVAWRDDGSLWFAGWEGFGSAFGVIGADGEVRWVARDPGIVGPSSFHARLGPSPDGRRLVAVREALRAPTEVVARAAEPEGEWSPLTAFNRRVAEALEAYPEVRELEWPGAGGLGIQGLLLVPDRGEPPYPTVVVIHGGPTWAWKRAFDPGGALPLWAAGFAVFLPNYRGSTGRGQTFTRLNLRDPAGAEFEDILLGVDHLVGLGLADPGRLGVTGGSYGGYLTAWAAVTTDRFRAAVMVSGITDMLSCHLTCNHAFSEVMFGGDQRDPAALRLFHERSPITHVARARTPTLILHGAEDRCTPLGQAEELYKALVLNGVETELVVYPREGHGFREREHALDAERRTAAWFARHLAGGTP